MYAHAKRCFSDTSTKPLGTNVVVQRRDSLAVLLAYDMMISAKSNCLTYKRNPPLKDTDGTIDDMLYGLFDRSFKLQNPSKIHPYLTRVLMPG
jgi:hypothetical protein